MSSFFRRVSHVGIVVENLEEALNSYSRGVGIRLERIVEIPDVRLKIGVLKIGKMEIELFHYGNPKLPMVKTLRGNRLGVNHICYEVKGFNQVMKKLMENGFKLIKGFPRKGVHGRIAFFIPPHSSEERIEILEVEGEHG
jgi:methylmalonyl-CoA/ethylmalonyl-CoA epimerase